MKDLLLNFETKRRGPNSPECLVQLGITEDELKTLRNFREGEVDTRRQEMMKVIANSEFFFRFIDESELNTDLSQTLFGHLPAPSLPCDLW